WSPSVSPIPLAASALTSEPVFRSAAVACCCARSISAPLVCDRGTPAALAGTADIGPILIPFAPSGEGSGKEHRYLHQDPVGELGEAVSPRSLNCSRIDPTAGRASRVTRALSIGPVTLICSRLALAWPSIVRTTGMLISCRPM